MEKQACMSTRLGGGSENLVAADLGFKGYYVFSPQMQSSPPCDLIAMSPDMIMIPIQVKTAETIQQSIRDRYIGCIVACVHPTTRIIKYSSPILKYSPGHVPDLSLMEKCSYQLMQAYKEFLNEKPKVL